MNVYKFENGQKKGFFVANHKDVVRYIGLESDGLEIKPEHFTVVSSRPEHIQFFRELANELDLGYNPLKDENINTGR